MGAIADMRERQAIASARASRGGLACPVCGSRQPFTPESTLVGIMIADGDPQTPPDEVELTADGLNVAGVEVRTMPGAAFICSQCGWVRFHVV